MSANRMDIVLQARHFHNIDVMFYTLQTIKPSTQEGFIVIIFTMIWYK
jgi:hypothetical protein